MHNIMANHEDFKDYTFRIDWRDPSNPDPKCEAVEVRLTVNDEEYMGSFVTRGFIDYMFEKNSRTGECSGGTYFCMPRMIVVERINEVTVMATIDDLISNFEMENYFERVDS